MNYEQIKHRVVEVTHNLKLVPGATIKELLGDEWKLPGVHDNLDVRYTHPRITCTVHLLETLPLKCYMDKDDATECCVCTLMVDKAPAFFFIRLDEKDDNYNYIKKVRSHTRILDWDTTQEFLHILMGLALGRLTDTGRVHQAIEREGVPELTRYWNEDIPWGGVPNTVIKEGAPYHALDDTDPFYD